MALRFESLARELYHCADCNYCVDAVWPERGLQHVCPTLVHHAPFQSYSGRGYLAAARAWREGATLDLKALAKCSGDRKVELVPLKEVQPLTGYIRGGVTALGPKKDFPVFLDETAQLWDVISISAGVRGAQILLSPQDYARATAAAWGEIARFGAQS